MVTSVKNMTLPIESQQNEASTIKRINVAFPLQSHELKGEFNATNKGEPRRIPMAKIL
jgi:hypothetical protein